VARGAEQRHERRKTNPSWPCCGRDKKAPYRIHELLFRSDAPGADVEGSRFYSQSHSRFRFLQDAYARPAPAGVVLPPNTIVAVATEVGPGVVFRADFDENAAVCFFRLWWNSAQATLQLAAFDEGGRQVGARTVAAGPDFQDVMIPLAGPARRVEARAIFAKSAANPAFTALAISTQPAHPVLAVDRAAYVDLRDYLDYLVGLEACNNGSDEFQNAYSGHGAVAFLPNHEYEMAVNTRITVTHPSKPSEAVEILEYVYFKTKGLPGLNAVESVGEEVAPYVRSAHDGGRGTLYREEPIVLAFTEDFHAAVPIAQRPGGTSAEHNTLLRMQLVVRPVIAPKAATPFTVTATDWIVDHRGSFVDEPLGPYRGLFTVGITAGTAMRSINPFRGRLAVLTGRPGASCALPDPLDVVGTTLIAFPQGETDPDDPAKELWPAGLAYTATVRPEGSGFVDRTAFVAEDLTAMSFSFDTLPGGRGAWSVVAGAIETASGSGRHFAMFGETTWNYVTIEVTLASAGQMAGVGVGLPGGPVPSRGLFAVVMPDGAGYRLAIFRRLGGSAFDEAAASPLPPGTDPAAAPLLLIVTAFDDRLRASVGETSIEIERDDLREGRACLIADGAVRIQSLKVTGLDIYRFPFHTSRYCSFDEHIQSFDGVIDVIEPDALGTGTTVSSVAALLSGTSADITTAMQPDADPAARQTLFERWIGALGLPLKDEVNALEVSRFVSGGKSGLMLFESPEPMDFSEEIRVDLSRRDHGLHPPVTGTLGDTADRIASRKARSRDDLLSALAIDETPGDRRPQPNPLLDVTRRGTDLDVRLNLSAIGAPAAGLLVVEAAGRVNQRRLVVYSLRIPRGATGEVTVRAVRTDEIVLGPGHSALVLPALAALPVGTFALVTADLSDILGTLIPGDVWTPVPLRLIQDAAGLRALLIPATGTTHSPLVPGTYRLTLTLDRQRWPSVDAPDEVNRYTRSQTLQLILE
jgi:hypothetical protein